MKSKIDTSEHNLLVNGEKVIAISLSYDELLKEGPIRANNPEKEPLITYHLADGGKWVHSTKIIMEEKTIIIGKNARWETNETICKHCGGEIAIRNPQGYCDHLYYPDYCEVCKSAKHK